MAQREKLSLAEVQLRIDILRHLGPVLALLENNPWIKWGEIMEPHEVALIQAIIATCRQWHADNPPAATVVIPPKKKRETAAVSVEGQKELRV